MNQLSVRWHVKATGKEGGPFLEAVIEIDRHPLVDFEYYGLAADSQELERTAWSDGEFFLITWTCGIPQCAGIKEAIEVRHQDQRVHWTYRNPFLEPETQSDLVKRTKSGRPEWVVRGSRLPTETFFFDADQYRKAIKRAKEQGHYYFHQLTGGLADFVPRSNRVFV